MKVALIKWLPALALVLAVMVASCTKEDVTDITNLNTISLESRGGHHHGDAINVDSLPAGILDYINANYPDSLDIHRAFLTDEGNYIVILSNHVAVVFDANGNFVEEITLPSGGGHGGPGGHNGTHIPVDSLSATITDYITANYPDSLEIHKAVLLPDGNTLVILSNHIGVVFDANGNFVEEITLPSGGGHGGPGNGGGNDDDDDDQGGGHGGGGHGGGPGGGGHGHGHGHGGGGE